MSQLLRKISAEDLPNARASCFMLRIFVDGERMSSVVAYDIDEGFVVRIMKDDEGRVLVCGDEVMTEIVRGEVRIEHVELSNA